jgi:hypothetical protein
VSDHREQRFTLDLRSGRILDATPEPPAEDLPEEEVWIPLGELDSPPGPRVDYSKARRWRPLSEFWRWR